MLRDFIINGAKAPDAMHKAKAAMRTGMAVVKEDTATDKYVKITTAETVGDLYFVNKERVPSGINAARGDMSDYDEDFVLVAADEFVKIDKYAPGEVFGTDQYTLADNTALDKRVSFKDGKAQVATVASPYIFKGFVNDNGHTLAKIEVSDVAVANS